MVKITSYNDQILNIKNKLSELGDVELKTTPKKQTGYFKLENHSFYFVCNPEVDSVSWQEVCNSHDARSDEWHKCKSSEVVRWVQNKLAFDRTQRNINFEKKGI